MSAQQEVTEKQLLERLFEQVVQIKETQSLLTAKVKEGGRGEGEGERWTVPTPHKTNSFHHIESHNYMSILLFIADWI